MQTEYNMSPRANEDDEDFSIFLTFACPKCGDRLSWQITKKLFKMDLDSGVIECIHFNCTQANEPRWEEKLTSKQVERMRELVSKRIL